MNLGTAHSRTMKLTSGLVGAVAMLLLAFGLQAGPADAAKPTGLSIYPILNGVTGEVSGNSAKRCFAGRSIEIFAVKGKDARRIGRSKARLEKGKKNPERGRYTWTLKTKNEGRMFARLSARKGCAGAKSRAVTGLSRHRSGMPKLNDIPACPERGTLCRLDQLHFDTGICPSFSGYAGTCGGYISGPPEWRGAGGSFHWSLIPFKLSREVRMSVYSLADMSKYDWLIDGEMSGPELAEWYVSNAYNRRGKDPNLTWRTMDAGIKAGEPGGPLYLNFENGIIGADVYVHGYLYMK